MQIPQPESFLHLSSIGWTAIGSIVGAVSILALSLFNWRYLVAARRAAKAAETTATASESQAKAAQESMTLLREQVSLTQRPFVAIDSEYCHEINARLVYASNQGNGPALDVQAWLVYRSEDETESQYGVGCLAVGGKFQFLIGDKSDDLVRVVFWYRSITGAKWTSVVRILGGCSEETTVLEGFVRPEPIIISGVSGSRVPYTRECNPA